MGDPFLDPPPVDTKSESVGLVQYDLWLRLEVLWGLGTACTASASLRSVLKDVWRTLLVFRKNEKVLFWQLQECFWGQQRTHVATVGIWKPSGRDRRTHLLASGSLCLALCCEFGNHSEFNPWVTTPQISRLNLYSETYFILNMYGIVFNLCSKGEFYRTVIQAGILWTFTYLSMFRPTEHSRHSGLLSNIHRIELSHLDWNCIRELIIRN